jgi:uncharacterized protein (DUF2147 family)
MAKIDISLQSQLSAYPRGLFRALYGSLLAALTLLFVSGPSFSAPIAVPPGVWLFDGKVAVQIYKCKARLCGRILWLQVPRDAQGVLDVDKNNPDPALRKRRLCGLTIIRGLKPLGGNHWEGGTLYNPDDGITYNVSAQLVSDNRIVARVFLASPYLGQNKTMSRIVRKTTDGWC